MRISLRLVSLSLLLGVMLQGFSVTSAWSQTAAEAEAKAKGAEKEAETGAGAEKKTKKQKDKDKDKDTAEGKSAKDAKGKAEAAAAKKGDTVAPQSAMMGLGSFGQLLPTGRKNVDVEIPSFKGGIPSSMLRAESMTRLDDSMMSMEKMDIWLYAANREADVRVQLPTAEYNMTTQILTSDQRSRVSRQDFQLEGDEMIFDTTTQQGKMTGRVEMIIFDTSSFTGGGAAAAAGASSDSGEEPSSPASPPQSATSTSANNTPPATAPESSGNPVSPTHEKK